MAVEHDIAMHTYIVIQVRKLLLADLSWYNIVLRKYYTHAERNHFFMITLRLLKMLNVESSLHYMYHCSNYYRS